MLVRSLSSVQAGEIRVRVYTASESVKTLSQELWREVTKVKPRVTSCSSPDIWEKPQRDTEVERIQGIL